MIAILDYGSGNLRSAQRAFELTGHEVRLTDQLDVAMAADGLVVPGVGAFAACMEQLLAINGDEIIRKRVDSGRAILGICVGMQILFDSGSEKGSHRGLGLLDGSVTRLAAPVLPHVGWNTVEPAVGSELFVGVEDESFYFVHSYAVTENGKTLGSSRRSYTGYGEKFISAIESGHISATQFHPEKSGEAGATLIKNWVETL